MIRIALAILALTSSACAKHFRVDQHDRMRDLARDFEQGHVAVALDRNMKTKMLVQVKARMPEITDKCGPIGECGDLKCPAGFTITEEPGHCCPYCVNPNIKPEDILTGPTGIAGGKPSFMCDNVWCFPTMCTSSETMPNEQNGLCCPSCER